jgi:hypothetical protein
MTDEHLALARRQRVSRNLRMSVRGVGFAMGIIGLVLSGIIPMGAGTSALLLALAGTLAFTRLLRGLWAVRVARHQLRGWRHRHLAGAPLALPGPVHAAPESADRRAIRALTSHDDEPLVARARARGLEMVDRMDELKGLLADNALSSVLRRPVAEALARTETDVEALLGALTDLSHAEDAQRDDLLQRLAARLEVDRAVPAGLLAPA